MRTQANKGIFPLVFFCILVASWMAGCASDPCKEVACVNGVCEDGSCVCQAGWTGPQCEVKLCEPDCGPHGDCVNGACECDPGWAGPACDSAFCEPACVNGNCFEAACICYLGWEGPACETRSSTKFVRSYNVEENCNSGAFTYSCTITESPTVVEEVSFSNFYDLVGYYGITTPLLGAAHGNTISIAPQTFTNGIVTLEIYGSGVRNDYGVIRFSYSITDDTGSSDFCTCNFIPL